MPNDEDPDPFVRRLIASTFKGAATGAVAGAVGGLGNPVAVGLGAAGGAAATASWTLVEESPRLVRWLWKRMTNRHEK